MKFDDLVQRILNEAGGVDPWKFAYKGAPMGFRKDTGISNPQKFTSTNRGPSDKGQYIEQDANRLIRAALLVTASDPEAGAELKRVLEEFNKVYFNYKNNLQELKSVESRLSKLPNQDSELALMLKERLKQYTDLTKSSKLKVDELSPDVINAVQDLVKEAGANFVKTLKDVKSKEFNSLDKLELEVEGDDEKRAIAFLKDMWRGKSEFEPLAKFAETERKEGKDPAVCILTVYKTVIDTMVRNNLVGSPERTFNFITGQANRVRSIVEPTKGKTEMKKKDPALLKVIGYLKNRKYNEAKQAVNETKLDNAVKADLMIKIDKLSKGEMTEAEVIRPLYSA